MTSHLLFTIVACTVLVCWVVALIGYLPPVMKRMRWLGPVALALGCVLIIGYMGWLWGALERPPMRTQGETKLWYTLLLPLISLIVEWRWRTRTLAFPATIMAMVFLVLTLLHPETLDKSLMPALRSPWFAPHVIVYMVSYAALGGAAAVAVWTLIRRQLTPAFDCTEALQEVDRLVTIGFPFMTMGLVMGAIWAKIAWGHYWSWDPKETAAFISWAMYLVYLHLRRYNRMTPRRQLALVTVAFLLILGCWLGVNKLPTATDSVHTYTQVN